MKTFARIALLAGIIAAASACAEADFPTAAVDVPVARSATPTASSDVPNDSANRGPVIGAGGH